MLFVGADVHVRNTYFYATDRNGHRLAHGRRTNTLADLVAFCESVLRAAGGEVQPIRFAMESTTNSRAMQRLIRQASIEAGFEEVAADVLNARKLRIIAESVTKCDALGAWALNELVRSNLRLPTCYIPDDEEFALREHLRARSDLVRPRTPVKNRIHALLHRRGIQTPQKALFTADGRRFLEMMTLDEAGRSILSRYLATLDHLDAVITDSDRDLRQVMRRARWAKPRHCCKPCRALGSSRP